ncbi:MAG: hypothetical protein F4X81_14730 [Gammaproteobacteria bacterium]|nr:hypothetical protein [Gammaproteobacteria bacterium]
MTERSTPSTVECPHCGTRFHVHQRDIAAAQGRLRCGACLKVFRALRALTPPDGRAGLRASFPAWVVVGLGLAVAALAVQITWLQTDYRARNLEISRSADSPGALAVQFVVLHDARIPAPFPTFDIEFATLGGEPVGSHRFRPGEYLTRRCLRPTRGRASGAKVDSCGNLVPRSSKLDAEPPEAEWLARLRLLAPETAHPVTMTIPHPGPAAAQVTISFPSRLTIGG